MVIHWEGPPQRIPWLMGLGLMVDQCQVMVQMAERDLSWVLDLMEDHLTEQIHRMD